MKHIIYAKYNYEALHSYYGAGAHVPLSSVVFIWANVIQERMKMEFPDITFSAVLTDKDIATFTYYVPEGEYRKWF